MRTVPPDRHRVSVDLALRHITLGYRVVGTVWLGVLAAVAMTREARGSVALGLVLLAAGWTVLAFVVAGRRTVMASPAFLAADVAIAALVYVVPAMVEPGAPGYSGGYPFAAVLHAAAIRGFAGGLPAGAVLGVTTVAIAGQPVVEQALFYLASPLVIAWAGRALRRNEAERIAAEDALAAERAERARAEERAETAAHLHDSVLQTLALLQRRSDRPDEVARLARRQERELRDWLSGDRDRRRDGRLAAALGAVGEEVEAAHDVRVDVVTVGDAPLDERLEALVAAVREAVVNAAKHAGTGEVAVYSEVVDGTTVWVRDRGAGFDPAAVPADRRGVRESIVGRMQRHGGSAELRTAPGRGTEVRLSMPAEAVPSSET